MKFFKTYISGFLLVVAVSYNIDLHGLSHTLENNHSDDSNHCELCIVNHQKDQDQFVLQPSFDDFDFNFTNFPKDTHKLFVSTPKLIQPSCFLGQLFNRPPPLIV